MPLSILQVRLGQQLLDIAVGGLSTATYLQQLSVFAGHHAPPLGDVRSCGRRMAPGRPADPLFATCTGRRLSCDAVALRVNTHAATAAQRWPSLAAKNIHPTYYATLPRYRCKCAWVDTA